MARISLTLTDDEAAAVQWAVAEANEPTIADVETWLYLKVRGEIRAAQNGYELARQKRIIEVVDSGDQTKSVADVVATVKDDLSKPREKGDAQLEVVKP